MLAALSTHPAVRPVCVSCAPVTSGYLALHESSTRFVSARRHAEVMMVGRARVDRTCVRRSWHGWTRDSAALAVEQPVGSRTSDGRSRRARDA